MTRILARYWRHLRHYPHYWIPLLVTVPAAVVCNNFALPWVLAQIIDRLSRGSVPLDQVWGVFGDLIVAFLAVILLGELILWRINVWLVWSLEAKMVQRLYGEAFDHLTAQPAAFHADRFVGTMVSTVNKYTGAYVLAIDSVLFVLLPLLTALVTSVVVLWPISWLLSVGLAAFTVLFLGLTLATYRPISRVVQAEAEAHTAIGGRLADVLSNIVVVKSFAREPVERAGFAERTAEHRARTVSVINRHVGRDIGFGAILTSLLVLTLVALLLGQAAGLGVGELVVMVTFTFGLFGHLWETPQLTRMYNRVYGDAKPMIELFDVRPTIVDPERPEHPRIAAGAIRFSRVRFTYPAASAPLFDGLDLSVPAGQRVGLVGPSGSGKTSITRLLLRFADVDSGSVTVDGQDVRDVTQQALRSRIAFVPQEPLMFHRSIAENIRYGRISATEAEVRDAAERAQVLEFADGLDEGLDTLVGERGVKLSGGQRQRIAVARAILSDAPVLVLDEATSALDSLSEARIQVALEEAMKGRTTIAIAHRLSTLRSMDRLVVLDRGRVVEDGPHERLVDADGIYADMWRRQSGGFVTV